MVLSLRFDLDGRQGNILGDVSTILTLRKCTNKLLTATKLNSLKPKDKTYRVSDANGLSVEVRPNGSKYWRQAYRYNGNQLET